MLKICLVSPLPPPYGGISHWTNMVNEHAAKNEDVDLRVINTAPQWRSIHHTGYLLRIAGGSFQLLRDIARLVKTLAGSKFDAVHLNTSGELAAIRDLIISYLTTFFKVGLVYHIRFGRIPVIAYHNSLEWRLICKVMHRATTVIVIDKATFLAVKQFAPKVSVVYIPNFVNIANLPTRDIAIKEKKVALFVGWVIPAKGINELIDAWKKIKQNEWCLKIVGPIDSTYKELLMTMLPPQHIELIGELPHSETMVQMANCDLFVLPSYTEGFPNVIVEAMALGRPIVASDVGAIPEMLADGAGIVVKSKDSNALAEALEQVLSNSDLRKSLGSKAEMKANHIYSIDIVFNEYIKVWKNAH